MSFSGDVKIELSKISNFKNNSEIKAELLGYLNSGNTVTTKSYIKYSTENEYNINRFAKLLSNTNINDYTIEIHSKIYSIKIKNKTDIDLNLDNDKNVKAYIRGSFLGSGFINNPSNEYHLEIVFNNIENAKLLLNLVEKFDIKVKLLEKNMIVYIKDGEEISKFLALIGANSAVLKFEQIRVMRDMKNNVNRIVNCETANLEKTIKASVEQIENIKKLKEFGKFNSLPESLKEIALLREKNPDANYEQLGNMLKKPITKSSVSNRFKKIKLEVDYIEELGE